MKNFWQYYASKIFLILSLGLTLSACQQGIEPGKQLDPLALGSLMELVKSVPANNETGVYLDQSIELHLSDIADAASVHPSNIEIWTTDGSRLPWKASDSIGLQVIKNPTDSVKCIIKIAPPSGYWLPLNKYFVSWTDKVPKDSKMNPLLAGIQSKDGGPLKAGAITFETGTKFKTEFAGASPRALAMAPGKLFTGENTDQNVSTFSDFLSSGYVTVNPDSDIKISFSVPIKYLSPDVDPFEISKLAPEMPLTPIEKISGMVVGVLDSKSGLQDFFSNIPDAATKPNEYRAFLQTKFLRTLKGTVETAGSRRVLIFRLAKNCPNPDECSYPVNADKNSIAQVVVVLVQGFLSADELNKPLSPSAVVGSFAHVSGYEMGPGYGGAEGLLGKVFKK